jgi:hypothetical protein
MAASSLASDETTSGSSISARTREEENTIIPSKVKPSSSSSPLDGGHALSCRLVSSFMNRFLNKDLTSVVLLERD